MALLIEGKKQIVAEVNEVASKAFSAVVADYQGLTVEKLTQLRVEARKLGVTTRIVRNTLAKRSFEGTQYDICRAPAEVSVIANLPNQEKALTMLASVLQAPVSKLGRLLTALKEKNESEAA